MSEVDIATPHLEGSCVTVRNQVHGLFRVVRARPVKPAEAASAYESVASWDLRPAIRAVSSRV
jgi:hypothetical protein